MDFKDLLSEVLTEQSKDFAELEEKNIICERTFYQYKDFTPYLPTIIKIANYLQVSLDYLSGRTQDNRFCAYKEIQTAFYDKLTAMLKSYGISQSKLSRELNISRPNFYYWKHGKLPKFATLINIANYLNCSIDDLLETE